MKSLRTLSLAAVAAGALVLTAGTAAAQTQPSREEEVIGAIFGALFGDRQGTTGGTIDAQWAAGRRPLYDQRAQFDARVDADVRSGALSSSSGSRLRSDYADLVALETRYGADRRFTSQERADLTTRYQALIRTLDDGGYDDGYGQGGGQDYAVAQGRGEFDARVDAQVRGRRLTRTQATRLKSDYVALIQVEAGYYGDGRLVARERDDLDARLDALDARVGDGGGGYGPPVLTSRARLDAVARALPTSGLNRAAQAQLQVEHEDLLRLEAAYTRYPPSSDDAAYLERRIAELETRVRIRR